MITIDTKQNLNKYKNEIIVDLTTIQNGNKFNKLSPYYPHGGIPIPNTPNLQLDSVNEVWQKLYDKGNERNKDDVCKSIRFKKGLHINEYFTYVEARQKIFIPIYCWMLENKAYKIIENLRKLLLFKAIVIIDRSINENIDDINKPLSCAFLLKAYIEGKEPYQNAIKEITEHHNIMLGRKCLSYKKTKRVYQKISYIYTGAQRIIDFNI